MIKAPFQNVVIMYSFSVWCTSPWWLQTMCFRTTYQIQFICVKYLNWEISFTKPCCFDNVRVWIVAHKFAVIYLHKMLSICLSIRIHIKYMCFCVAPRGVLPVQSGKRTSIIFKSKANLIWIWVRGFPKQLKPTFGTNYNAFLEQNLLYRTFLLSASHSVKNLDCL